MISRSLVVVLVGSVFAATALPGCSDQGSSDGSGGSANGGTSSGKGGQATNAGGPSSGGRAAEAGSGGGANGGNSSTGSGGTTSGGATNDFGGRSSGGASSNSGGATGVSSGGRASAGAGGKGAAGASNGGANSGGTNSANSGGSAGATSASGGIVGNAGAGGGSTSGGPVKVWIAGDSTVQNCSSACPCGWGSQFDPLFNSNVTVQNSAVGGRSIQTWLYDANVSSTMTNGECALSSTAYNARWTAMTNTSTGMKSGDYLFIQFGINDGDSTCPRHVGLTLFKDYLGKMAQAAKDHGAQPIFLTPVSAISCNSSGKAVGTRGSFVTATIEAGTTYGVPVIDLHQLSVDLYNSLGLCPNNSDYTMGKVGDFFCEDHTHFEAAGAKQIAQVIAKALRDQKIGLASYLL